MLCWRLNWWVLKSMQLANYSSILGHLLSYIPFLYSAFSLTPNSIFLFHLWKPVTAIFMEINPILIAWSILALHQLIHMIEPVWTLSEVVKFAAITQVQVISTNKLKASV